MKSKKGYRKAPAREEIPAAAARGPETTANDAIPTLTEVVAPARSAPSEETLSALQAELAARVQKLAEELLHGASREMEAVLFEKVCDALRAKLPELIDETLRAQLK